MDKKFFIVKIGRILCIENVLPLLRIGMLLGLMAWFMQLVVFIQPLLPGGTLPGIGVCLTVVDAIQGSSHQSHQNQLVQNHVTHNNTQQQQTHAAHGMHDHQHMHMDMSMPMQDAGSAMQAHDAGPAGHTSADHYLNHLSCGFCSLFGHALPASMTSPVWFEVSQRPFVTLPPFADQSIDVLNVAYLHPKSRAPPFKT